MNETIALIGCGKEKQSQPAPAKELYTGPLFQAARRWAKANTDAYYIASAKHLVVDPDQVIEPYDLHLGEMRADDRLWRARQIERQFHLRWVEHSTFAMGPAGFRIAVEKPRVVLLASQLYLRAFYERLARGDDLYDFEDPLRGLSIGKRLQWLSQQTKTSIDQQLFLFEV